MLTFLVHVVHLVSLRRAGARSISGRGRVIGCAGQSTAEYALVLLGAATIAMLVVTWASSSGAVGKLFDAVVSHVIGAVT